MEKAYVLQIRDGSLRNMTLKFCGYSECNPLHNFGPASRPVYIIHVVLKGKGVYIVDNKRYNIKEGQGFIIEPNVVTFYQADANEPWSYCWIAFDGEGVDKYLQELGLVQQKPIFRTERARELFELIEEMLKSQKNNLANELKLQGLFYQFFSIIVEENSVENIEKDEELNPYVNKALDYIKRNYWDDINVNKIIKYVGLNRSYFSNLFRTSMGITLQEYLSVFRLSRANELLDMTDESIEEIASNCGYNDPLVFSKAYKRKYGITPTQHRKIDRKRVKENLEKFKKYDGREEI